MDHKQRQWLASRDANGCLDKSKAHANGVALGPLIQERFIYNAGPIEPESQWDLRITECGLAALQKPST